MKLANKAIRGPGAVLANRESGEAGETWVMVAPRGEHPITVELLDGSKAEIIQVIDALACESMLNRFEEERKKNGAFQLLVDFDHFSEDPDKSSRAAAWCSSLQNREDGIYGLAAWTGAGRRAVEEKDFRFISPVFDVADCEALGNRRFRPMRLDAAALTNAPNIKGIKPLINRDNALEGQEEKVMDWKALLLGLLGLAPEATDEEVTAGMETVKGKLTNAETQASELEALKKTELEGQVASDMDEFKDVIKEEDKEKVKDQLMKNREGTRALLGSIVKPVKAAEQQKLLNRKDGQSPELGKLADADKAEKRSAYVEEIRLKNRCSHSEAWAQAATLKPELFK